MGTTATIRSTPDGACYLGAWRGVKWSRGLVVLFSIFPPWTKQGVTNTNTGVHGLKCHLQTGGFSPFHFSC